MTTTSSITAQPSDSPTEPTNARRDALLQPAIGVFLRYGYKKTSMDDLASAAGVSRQGLYLHFPTKEALFREAVILLVNRGAQAMRAALARADVDVEERVLEAFTALKSQSGGGEMAQEHMNELFSTAKELVGSLIEDIDQALIADLAQLFETAGVAARWQSAGLDAMALAQHMYVAAQGIKHHAKTTSEYRERMTVAVRIVCRGGTGAVLKSTRKAKAAD